MKFTVLSKTINDTPRGVTRVSFVEMDYASRFLKEGGVETLEIGINREKLSLRDIRLLARTVVEIAKTNKIKRLAVEIKSALVKKLKIDSATFFQQIAENAVMANFEFNHFKTRPKEGWNYVDEIIIFTDILEAASCVKKGVIVGEEVNSCRVLANTPGGDMTPTKLAIATKKAVNRLPVKVKVLSEQDMKREGMGAILGVAKGSSEKPSFIILEYKPSVRRQNKGARGPIVLAGKGVTFDSGGLNVKSESGMYEMHMDMSGAAAVIHTIALSARLKLKKHIVGLIPAVENMSGGSAYRPGDILKSLSGKTIEVLNTDAEGRLILADALTYAKCFKPSVVIDVATLTGASVIALGQQANALMTRDDGLSDLLLKSAENSGDYLWRLPLWDEYEESLKSSFADVANVPGNSSSSRYGGAINGGIFLWQFAKDLSCPWAHIDIAPKMTSTTGEHLAKGATGTPVRLLIHYIEQWMA